MRWAKDICTAEAGLPTEVLKPDIVAALYHYALDHEATSREDSFGSCV